MQCAYMCVRACHFHPKYGTLFLKNAFMLSMLYAKVQFYYLYCFTYEGYILESNYCMIKLQYQGFCVKHK